MAVAEEMIQEQPAVRAIIFDWAGTAVDFGSFAPVASIVETFEARGVSLAPAEARGPMGLEKKEHIRRLLADAGIRERWRAATSHYPVQEDVEALFEDLESRLLRGELPSLEVSSEPA